MKLKKIASLCSQSGRIYLQDRETGYGTEQWLGDGYAAYPLVGLPYMDIDNICAMFDIPEKKQEKMILRQVNAPDILNWEDTDPMERRLDDSVLRLRYEGRELLPLETSAGITFIQEKYLAPLDGLEYMQLFERRSRDGGVYIAAKIGMVVQAIIMPMDVISADLIDRMETLTGLCRTALAKKNPVLSEGPDEGQSTLFRVDEGTGEIVGEGTAESEKHCRECICRSCDLFKKDGCLEGADHCAAKCDHKSPTRYCPWHPSELEGQV